MTAIKEYFLSNSCYVHIAAGKSNETNRKRENMRKLTRPRQHRHLKRKVHIAASNGRFCGAKRPQCEADRPQAVAFVSRILS